MLYKQNIMSSIAKLVLDHYVLVSGGDVRVSDVTGVMTSRGRGESAQLIN